MAGKIRPCVHCGTPFRPEFPKGAARTCSNECAKARRRVTANAAGKRYYAAHTEALRNTARDHARAADPEERREKWNAWARRNREHRNAYSRKRYAETPR